MKHILISMDEIEDIDDNEKPSPSNEGNNAPEREQEREAHQNMLQSDTVNVPLPNDLPPPPADCKPICLHKKRQSPPGMSSLGISVLSTKGWVAGLDNSKIDLQLDSCADVTLISEEFFNTLKNAPRVQQGMRMKLWQLTDKNEKLKGYV